MSWTTGTRIGDYEIVREIARGGMGVVFEAQQTSLRRRVALKVIRGVQLADSTDRRRFLAEAEAIARLEHPGIVPIHEVTEFDGLQFFSMAYMAGGSLRDLATPLEPGHAADLLARICDAVHFAHTRSIVHRDLKPANVLLDESMRPRVTDFGLAKDTSHESDLTCSGSILGTPGYMAPEQASGDPVRVGHLADVYGLGAILFYLLTGHPPVEGTGLAETLHKLLHEEAPDPRRRAPGVPTDLSIICRKALEKDAADRYDSAAALATDLRRFLRGEAPLARPLSPHALAVRWCRRHAALATALAVAVVALLGGTAAATWYAMEADQSARRLAVANEALQLRNAELAEARDAASASRADAEAFGDFLIEDVIRAARPRGSHGAALGTDVTVREALLAAVDQLDVRFAGRPLAGAEARLELAVTLRHTGEEEAACELLQQAWHARRDTLGPNAQDTLLAMNSYGTALFQSNRDAQALALFVDLTARTHEHVPQLHVMAMLNLAANYEKAGRTHEALETLRAVQDLADADVLPSLHARLAVGHAQLGDATAAREELQHVAESVCALSEPLTAFDALRLDFERVQCLQILGEDEPLAALAVRTAERARRIVQPTDRAALRCSLIATDALERLGRIREAAEELQRTVEARHTLHEPADLDRIERCAGLFLRAGEPQTAIEFATRCRDLWQSTAPEAGRASRVESLLRKAQQAAGPDEGTEQATAPRLSDLGSWLLDHLAPHGVADQRP